MTLFRANDRHPVDERVLIIQDMEDFRLWRERAKLGISGIIWDLDIDEQTKKGIVRELDAWRDKVSSNRDEPISRRIFLPKDGKYTEKTSPDNRCDIAIGPLTFGISNSLVTAYDLATEVISKRTTYSTMQAYYRVNSTHPRSWHTHPETITCAFQQSGTVCHNGPSNYEIGDQYALDPFQAGLMSDEISHKAYQNTEDFAETPRYNTVIYSSLYI